MARVFQQKRTCFQEFGFRKRAPVPISRAPFFFAISWGRMGWFGAYTRNTRGRRALSVRLQSVSSRRWSGQKSNVIM